jgi:hypothetical protein
MFPVLNETVASTYLLVLVALQVFNLGIPGLILHLTPDGVRRLAERYRWHLFSSLWILSIYLLILCILLTLYLFPYPGIPLLDWIGLNSICTITWVFIATGWGAGYAVALAVIWTAIVWYLMAGDFVAGKLVKILSNRIKRTFLKTQNLDEQSIEDIFILGIHGDPAYEKNMVIREIKKTIKFIQQAPKYDGRQLGPMIRKLPNILFNSEKPGNDENIQELLKVFRDAMDQLQFDFRFGNAKPTEFPDYNVLRSVFGRITIDISKSKSQALIYNVVEAVRDDPYVLLQIGINSIDCNNADLTVPLLNKLESLAENPGLGMNIKTACLLGLFAYCNERGGDALKWHVESYFEKNPREDIPNFQAIVEYAQKELREQYLTPIINAMANLVNVSDLKEC